MNLFAVLEAEEMDFVRDVEADAFFNERAKLVAGAGEGEADVLICREDLGGDFEKGMRGFLLSETTEEEDEFLGEGWGAAKWGDFFDAVMDGEDIGRRSVVVFEANFASVVTDGDGEIGLGDDSFFDLIDFTSILGSGAVVAE